MHLFKYHEDGPLYFRFRLNGKIYVRSSKTRNRQIAERAAYQFRDTLIAATTVPGGAGLLTLKDALSEFADSKMDQKSHRTLKSHIDFILARVPKDITLDKLTNKIVADVIKARKETASAATTKHTLNCFRATLKYAKKMGFAVAEIEWPEVKVRNQRQRYLTAEEEKNFLAQIDPNRKWTKMGTDFTEGQKAGLQQNYDIGIALLDTGARLSEVIYLEWKDVNLKDKTVVMWRTKTHSGTTLTMTDRLYQVLDRRFKDKRSERWVFPGVGDKPAVSAGARIRKAIKRAGLKDFRLHDIRHSYASKLVQNGLSLYEVASALGHASPNTSARYAHLEKRAVADKAASVLNQLNGTG